MDVFIGSLMLVPYNYEPKGFAFCDGRTMIIQQNSALYSLLGVAFGGDGKTTFKLPDLRGRFAIGAGQGPGLQNYTLGQQVGVEAVTLEPKHMPSHSHSMLACAPPSNTSVPAGNGIGTAGASVYKSASPTPPTPDAPLATTAIESVGGNGAHDNMMPYQTLNWIIATSGLYPVRS